jgi:thiopeptide-type bacteriocin biosynthesis protein
MPQSFLFNGINSKDRTSESEIWIAAHLYHSNSLDKLIVEGILPFIEVVTKEKSINQFFFIRYNERGQHIRLRLKVPDHAIKIERLKQYLISHFMSYFKNFPSKVIMSLEKKDWFPNDSIQFIKYIPEFERYGGKVGVLLAEKQFYFSSRKVLMILHQKRKVWDYSYTLGFALQLHLGFAFAMKFKIDEVRDFFAKIFYDWLPLVIVNTNEEIADRKETVLRAFELKFEEQKASIIPLIEKLISSSTIGIEFTWLDEWINENREIGRMLKFLIKKGELKTKTGGIVNFLKSDSCFSILGSYVHMTNNRIGVLNQDESFLAFLIIKSIDELKKKPTERN